MLLLDGDNLLGVMGNHLNDYSNNQVEGLWIYNQEISSLPTGIAEIFSNLKFLQVDNSQLKTISKEDLSPFPNLRHIDFYNNQLEVLDGDLLVGNLNLEYIDFGDNKIKNVGSGLLDPLTKLTIAFFENNICINQDASSASEIVTLKKNLTTQCLPLETENLIKSLVDNATKPLKQNISQLQALSEALENKSALKDQKILALESTLKLNVEATKELESQSANEVRKLDRRMTELEIQLDQM